MPEAATIRRARQDKAEGKSASTQAGEFVKEQIDRIRAGKHGARSAKQAIAIGLSEARRAGVKLGTPKKGKVSERVRMQAKREGKKATGRIEEKPVNPKRSRAATKALQRESSRSASKTALSRQAHSAAAKRTPAERKASARKAVATRKRRGT